MMSLRQAYRAEAKARRKAARAKLSALTWDRFFKARARRMRLEDKYGIAGKYDQIRCPF